MTGSKLCPRLGVRTAQVFTVSTVLGSAEDERWQAGPRFSPPQPSSWPNRSLSGFLVLVGLKIAAVNVVLVDLNKRVPLLRQIFLCKDCRHRTDRYTGPAVNALGGIDVKLSHLIVGRSTI